MAKTDGNTKRDAVDFEDLWQHELKVLAAQRFPPFGADLAPTGCAKPYALYEAIFKEMKTLRCARCDMKGHERGACWVLQQMYQTSRKLGEKHAAAYA
jgi:hypothetical protein